MDHRKTPFPWFGGKADAAPHVWAALGDVDHYVEPFAGSLAVLLRRTHPANRTYRSETVNDLDGLLVNFWRAVEADPVAVAHAASWPVSELDKHARSCALLAWRDQEMPALLAGDPRFHDTEMAGWWAWAVSCQIGAWGTGGPWWPDKTGRLRKHANGAGVTGDRPHLANNGQGINHANLREPGVGVPAGLPHLGDDGQGVNRPQLREDGVGVPAGLPHLGDNGRGVNHANLREPGVGVPGNLPYLTGDGRGVNHVSMREPGVAGIEYHPTTMPRLVEWLSFLSARLRHVRILHGDWQRALTNGAMITLPVRTGGVAGAFLDPPYAHEHRKTDNVYAHEDATVADRVRHWCAANGDDPRRRIVLAGYDTEHGDLDENHGWTVIPWYRDGFLKGGMGNTGGGGHDQHRERLWLSPHCIQPAEDPQLELFAGMI